ncbi:MAG TPA: hypothetical protein VHB73_03265, partial [Alphaproteobacteria bacterium]|nr:hypothetical protein [Alphaproteobacteria bacterium]
AGMLPTLAMSISDRSPGRSLTICVGSLNVASCLQALLMLLPRGLGLPSGLEVLMRPETFLIMWGGAALGLGLYTFIPALVAGLLSGMADVKIARLRQNQKELRRSWGDDVSAL